MKSAEGWVHPHCLMAGSAGLVARLCEFDSALQACRKRYGELLVSNVGDAAPDLHADREALRKWQFYSQKTGAPSA